LQNIRNTGGGPEGLLYVLAGNPEFAVSSVLIAEWSIGEVNAYELDSNGLPIAATRRLFMSGLSGAEGAIMDPLTGDFLFSTFGGGDQVIRVSGFVAPPPPDAVPLPAAAVLFPAGLGLIALMTRRRKKKSPDA
jgi:hypothetical protein